MLEVICNGQRYFDAPLGELKNKIPYLKKKTHRTRLICGEHYSFAKNTLIWHNSCGTLLEQGDIIEFVE